MNENPISLLLELVKKDKKDIFEVNLEEIIDSYLQEIKQLQELNLDIASSYITMAGDLLLIKSKKLLPNNEAEQEYEEALEELREKIINYEIYQNLAQLFQNKKDVRDMSFSKTTEDITIYRHKLETSEEYTIDLLSSLFKKIIKEKEPVIEEKTIKRLRISVKDRMKDIKDILFKEKKVSFNRIINKNELDYIVASFLAILELSRLKFLLVKQDDSFNEIVCEVNDDRNN